MRNKGQVITKTMFGRTGAAACDGHAARTPADRGPHRARPPLRFGRPCRPAVASRSRVGRITGFSSTSWHQQWTSTVLQLLASSGQVLTTDASVPGLSFISGRRPVATRRMRSPPPRICSSCRTPSHSNAAVAMVGTGRTTMGILEAAVLTAGDVVLVTGPRAASAICWCRRRWPPGQPSSAPLVAPRRARPSGFGALHVVDSGDPLWPTTARDELGDRGITVVLDGVGGDIATAAMNVLVPGIWCPGPARCVAAGCPRCRRIRAMGAADRAAFALADAAAAQTAMVRRRTVGKTVLYP